MDTETLHKECERLESAINDMKNKLDLKNQEFHKYTNDISLAKVLELEYLEEIESQQKIKSSATQDLRNGIKKVKDNLTCTIKRHQDEMARKSKIKETLKNQIKERKRALALKSKTVKKTDDVDRETEKNTELKKAIDVVTVELEKVEENYDDLKSTNQELQATKEFFMKKLEDLKSSLKIKSEELKRIQSLMQDLEKSNFDNKLKLDSLKCKPLDPTKKGNSMFGEVEDSCVKLQQKMQQIKNYNSSIEKELKEDCEEMQHYIQGNAELKKNIQEKKFYKNEFQEELDKLLPTLPFLESKIEEYKSEILKECEFVAKNPPSFNVTYVNYRIKSLWREVIAAGDELNAASQEVLNTFKTLEDVNKSLREKKRYNFLLECKIDELDYVLLQLQQNMSSDEIKRIFKDNSFVTEVIDGSTTEKKAVKENDLFNTSSSKETANLSLGNCDDDVKEEIENSKLDTSKVEENPKCLQISDEVECLDSDLEKTQPTNESNDSIIDLQNHKLMICSRIPISKN